MKNPQINITFEEDETSILEALSRREDMVLSAIAENRDTKNAKMVSHEDVWKNVFKTQ